MRDDFRRNDPGLPRLAVADIMAPNRQAGLRAFVTSGSLGEPDSRARYGLPRTRSSVS